MLLEDRSLVNSLLAQFLPVVGVVIVLLGKLVIHSLHEAIQGEVETNRLHLLDRDNLILHVDLPLKRLLVGLPLKEELQPDLFMSEVLDLNLGNDL